MQWLEAAGHERIVLIDNDSTWEPMRVYLLRSPHKVHLESQNWLSRAPWDMGIVPDEWWAYTDSDLVPLPECPYDLVDRCIELLHRYPGVPKAGPGLYLGDVPEDLYCLRYEQRLIANAIKPEPGVFYTVTDTTFCVYRPGAAFQYSSFRLGFPYQARHSSWYVQEPDDEIRHYLSRASRAELGSSWAKELDNRGRIEGFERGSG